MGDPVRKTERGFPLSSPAWPSSPPCWTTATPWASTVEAPPLIARPFTGAWTLPGKTKKRLSHNVTLERFSEMLFYRVSHSSMAPLQQIRVKCLAQRQINKCFTLSGIRTSNLSLTAPTLKPLGYLPPRLL